LKSKVGLAAAKAEALRINLNIEGCGVVAPPMPDARSVSRSPSSPPPSFTQSPFSQRSRVRDGQTSPHKPRLVVSHSTCPPLSPSPSSLANSFVMGTAVTNNNCVNNLSSPSQGRPRPASRTPTVPGLSSCPGLSLPVSHGFIRAAASPPPPQAPTWRLPGLLSFPSG
jgi:hypothetical protein